MRKVSGDGWLAHGREDVHGELGDRRPRHGSQRVVVGLDEVQSREDEAAGLRVAVRDQAPLRRRTVFSDTFFSIFQRVEE